MDESIKEVIDIPFSSAEAAITRINEIEYDNSRSTPFSRWYLACNLSCPLCGNWLSGYNGKFKTWDCACSTWYEEVSEDDTLSWLRNPKLKHDPKPKRKD